MRPLHHELVTITQRYAFQMANAAKNTLMQQASDDAGEARHLQETLKRMYREHKDPHFELAIGRAEGIAAHYTRKEQALNKRLADEDQTNILQDLAERADSLGRRKVSKPSTRNRSRSRSRDNNTNPQKKQKNVNANSKQQKTTSTTPNNQPNPKPQNQQPTQQKKGWKQQNNKNTSSYQGPRASGSNTTHQPRQSSSHTSHDGQRPSGSTSNRRGPNPGQSASQTQLNAEEQQLIQLLRAAKQNNKQ